MTENNSFFSGRTLTVLIVLFIVGLLGFTCFSYNFLVQVDVGVMQKQAQVQTALEQRADLIPNLVSTIKGSAAFERNTLLEVIEARNTALRTNLSNADTVDKLQKSSEEIDSNIDRLLVVVEQYPTLKTTEQFNSLQGRLSDTEDQIRKDRNAYNQAVADYQQVIRSTPTNFFAWIFGFRQDRYQMFSAAPEKQAVPVVAF